MKCIKDISYCDMGNPNQKLDLYIPDCEEFSVFVYFHGGGLESGDKGDVPELIEYLISKNIAVVSANYRMYPTAVFPEYLRDAAGAVAWVKNHIGEYGKCEKIFVGGSSAGGYISMMLCFDGKYLAPYGINPADLAGFVHDAGQPTTHYKVMRERGFNQNRIVVDEAAPAYFIGTKTEYPPMIFIVSDNDMVNRYEQTQMMLTALKQFGYSDYKYKLMHGTHCHYVNMLDENGDSVLGKIAYEFIEETK